MIFKESRKLEMANELYFRNYLLNGIYLVNLYKQNTFISTKKLVLIK